MAVTEQLNKYWHVSNMFQSSVQERTAKMLADASGIRVRCFFANSGAEANEAAIKLARKATGKSKIVTCLAVIPRPYVCNDGSNGTGKNQDWFRTDASFV